MWISMPRPRFHGFTIQTLESPLAVIVGVSVEEEMKHLLHTIPLFCLEEVPDQVRKLVQKIVCLW